MKKINILLLLGASIALLTGCNGGGTSSGSSTTSQSSSSSTSTSEDTRPDYEKGEVKDVNGEGLMFVETVGYSTKDASIFEENNKRYITYVDNETRNGARVFAAREGTLIDGVWVYGERHVTFRGSSDADAWDQYIYQPSVVKGNFVKGTETYHYLLAYHGNDTGADRNNSIGFAVSNNVLGEWIRVGDEPLIQNSEVFESCYGFGSPSLLNIDENGMILICYSYGEALISGERAKFADFSNLEDIKIEKGFADISNKGLLCRDDGVISNAGFAIGSDGTLLIVNDNMPDSSAPGCATSIEFASAKPNIVSDLSESWTSIKKISAFDTMGEETLGWDEIYSGDFVKDPYGHAKTANNKIEICYSTYNVEAANPSQTAQLCMFTYSYGE